MAASIGPSGPCDSPCDQSRDPLRPMKIRESLVARCRQGAVTLVTPKIHMYPGGYCPTPVTPRIHRVLLGIRIWSSLANASVKITKNSATSIEYENWDNISWPHQILRRNYMKFVFWICDRAQLKARFLAQWNISNITIKMLWNGSNKYSLIHNFKLKLVGLLYFLTEWKLVILRGTKIVDAVLRPMVMV